MPTTPIDKTRFNHFIRDFQFKDLFNELGWDYLNEPIYKNINNVTITVTAVANKEGFRVFVCNPLVDGQIPDSNTRKKIQGEISKLFHENLIIFFDKDKTQQVWQLIIFEHGKPIRTRQITWYKGQEPELLYQRLSGIFFTLDEEDNLTIVDVTQRIRENFGVNTERVTKKFYDQFKREHAKFLEFIKGIEPQVSREWYASLMLNRLMFCYFIQKQGFLNNDKDYLRTKLNEVQAESGKNKFYRFYYDFLKNLFHKGLGSPHHSDELKKQLGRIPYLNGGLFDVHSLEVEHTIIQIEDAAFESIFDFFDQWEWHLDVRPDASGREINPDVIGFIFEKYINDRAQMGAYYTKEDITDYISKNCIIPFLFDEVERHYAKSFKPDGENWQMLKNSRDAYIYDAVKYGIPETFDDTSLFDDLPDEVKQGFSPELEKKIADGNGAYLVDLRKSWNKSAPQEIALPTEIYREVIDRRKRYAEIKKKIDSGEIIHINDFITYNLNIRQFAQDVLENTSDPELIKHFYKTIVGITILDPTCGSGAFLFAALNILEPLYETCIQRMETFVAEAPKGRYKFFEDTLAEIKSPQHPNLPYFIYKSIILRNLFGVDIMKEAVEIAKLRLFLKLVATVDPDYNKPNLGLEPLPDIDFNIRAGNTLIGFATEDDIEKALEGKLDFDSDKKKIKEKCDIVARAFERFKEIQLTHGDDAEGFRKAKDELNKRLKELNAELNQMLHNQYYGKMDYNQWLATHQPFHWFAEFYQIINGKGGFDVIIGNPPYVEHSKVRNTYKIYNYETESCGNLYAYVVERNKLLLSNKGHTGMIIPHSAFCTDRMESLINLFDKTSYWISTYSIRPAKLFVGVDQRLAIYVTASTVIPAKAGIRKGKDWIPCQARNDNYCTRYYNWNEEFRQWLFDTIAYASVNSFSFKNSIPKVGKSIEEHLWQRLNNNKIIVHYLSGSSIAYFHNAPRYWIRAMDFAPYFWNERDGEQISTQVKSINLSSKLDASVATAALNSSLFYWWFIILSDCRHLNMREIENFPIGLDKMSKLIKERLSQLCDDLMDDYKKHAYRKECTYKTTGKVIYDEFYPKHSKPIIDEIDKVLAQHYGFTHEELDFIINYDIKYRMGQGSEEEI